MPEDAGLAVYALVARDDAFGFAGVEDKIPALEETLGRDNVVVRILDNYWHGANLGEGTDGEGWIQDAMDFWEERREAWADGHDGDLVDAYVE